MSWDDVHPTDLSGVVLWWSRVRGNRVAEVHNLKAYRGRLRVWEERGHGALVMDEPVPISRDGRHGPEANDIEHDETNPELVATERRCPRDPTGSRWHPDLRPGPVPRREHRRGRVRRPDGARLSLLLPGGLALGFITPGRTPVAPKPAGRMSLRSEFCVYELHRAAARSCGWGHRRHDQRTSLRARRGGIPSVGG